ncbi:Multiphosphoryl transfer protein (Includes: Phosphoenolpyruvate-protein phosphotransferase; Phosphocarrier protein HPr; Fructose-specific phosphotransferase enzyme IIA component) [Cupriavidus taiwanensis]|uniref:phosphoenolpyruvate--protein phosphotransferase n=1 Tax=Cupriavidus taiwanensis TaxID=164546 RepID=UPI000E1B03C8|nr:phosphoenolpyruvate--protein phosphotransferase [Cupriavidus taiwanensis]SOZ14955.1 Multiphosphoryl transfer protein (Includes: Phosphoenolpyruvate-protein phosphotransferase; Phosphocarrier protein HPr; Fructose-specific phosphotransferase enzyme IIA component) [Cupriavidus taiwanensis]SOZ26807.1 Multiphosphoryl transfer protein (Includes: Phosphoenolpyruvate-protein phosphotransferase; Phosphocarrier protein HPr; Fructose-specific phosphotransferase enzyme IIA component) [Cupriavidus taiwane
MAETSETLLLLAPLRGVLLPLAAVPDPVFAEGLFGEGVAIDPLGDTLVAPCDGVVLHLAATGHALTLQAPCGAQVLLHVGIDTVSLRGDGFAPCVAQGTAVRQGDPLIRFDADRVARQARSLVTVMAVANGNAFAVASRSDAGLAETGRTVVLQVRVAGAVGVAQAATPAPPADVANVTHAAATRRRTVTLACAGGLHARPAARARGAMQGLDATVTLHYGGREASLASLVALLALSADEGATVELAASGRDADAALDAVARELQRTDAGEAHAVFPVGAAPAAPGGDLPRGCIAGVSAASGIAIGPLHWWRDTAPEPDQAGQGVAAERAALRAALAAVDAQLAHDSAAAEARRARAEAGIFAMHRALLEDPALRHAADALIDAGNSAGFAWSEATRAEAATLSAQADRRAADRAADVLDLGKRVLRALAGSHGAVHATAGVPLADDAQPVVLAADEFTPSDLTGLDPNRVAALVMVRGGPTAHAAIIARQLGIPCLVALGGALEQWPEGTPVIADGDNARLYADPDADLLAAAASTVALRARQRQADLRAAHTAACTRDGVDIEVAANIGSVDDARDAVAQGADAVGLLRTELLFLHGAAAPTVADHTARCQAVADALDGRSAIVRTLDIGADKDAAWLRLPAEDNPALGLRGVRLAQACPQLLDDQLRGLLAVRAQAPLRILLPMVSEVGELLHWRTRIRALAAEAGADAGIEVGVMIEVPAAALLAEQLAEHADFFSIGTNDLTQYTLAMDRCQPALAARMDALHPAVLRLIAATTEGAARHGRWVGVCGALAGDALAVPVLLGLGVTELSVDAALVPATKARVRTLSHADCRQRAPELLRLASAAAVREACRRYWPA